MEKGESLEPVLPLINSDLLIRNNGSFIHVSAPGKVILHGEHSVVYGRLAVAASLGLRTHLTLTEEPSNNELCINLSDFDHNLTIPLKEIISQIVEDLDNLKNISCFNHPETSDHSSLLQKIDTFLKPRVKENYNAYKILIYLLSTMVLPFFKPAQTIKVDVRTELQISSGMGSSASYAVSIAAAFYEYLRIHCYALNPSVDEEMVHFLKSLNPHKSKGLNGNELKFISAWAFQGEKITHGNPSGVDNTICTFGSIVKFVKGEEPTLLHIKKNLRVLLVDTGVPKDTKALVAKVASFKKEFPEVVEEILTNLHQIALKAYKCFVMLNDEHLSKENIEETYKTLALLADTNQELLKQLGVSHQTIDEICSILQTCGFHPKLTGAGGGGFVISLVPPIKTEEQISEVIDSLNSKKYKAVLVNLGGEGVRLH